MYAYSYRFVRFSVKLRFIDQSVNIENQSSYVFERVEWIFWVAQVYQLAYRYNSIIIGILR